VRRFCPPAEKRRPYGIALRIACRRLLRPVTVGVKPAEAAFDSWRGAALGACGVSEACRKKGVPKKRFFPKMDICAKSPIKADRRLAFIGAFVMRFFPDRGLFHGPVRRQGAPL